MKAIIMAAGKGTRMQPLSLTTPKLLLPIFNQPLLDHFVEILKDYFDEIVLIVSEPGLAKIIRAYIKKQNYPIKISFVYQDKLLGTAHALQTAKKKFNPKKPGRFLVMNGDDIYAREDVEKMLENKFAVLGKKFKNISKFGALFYDKSRHLIKIIEKPKTDISDTANIGMYLLGTKIFELFPKVKKSPRGEYEITDTISLFAKEVDLKVVQGDHWMPVGYPWHLLKAQIFMAKIHEYKIQGSIAGKIKNKQLSVGSGSKIGKNVKIQGPVVIGGKVTIKPGTKIKGPVSIGDGSFIGPDSVLSNCVLMKGVKLKGQNQFKDGIMGNQVVLEKGAQFLNQRKDGKTIKINIKRKKQDTELKKFSAVIGDQAQIGKNAVISPGVVINPKKKVKTGEKVEKDVL